MLTTRYVLYYLLAYRGGPPFRLEGGVCSEYLEVEVMVDLTGSEYLGDAPMYPAFIFTGSMYPAFIFTGWIGTAWLLAELGLEGGGVRALVVADEGAAATVAACRT